MSDFAVKTAFDLFENQKEHEPLPTTIQQTIKNFCDLLEYFICSENSIPCKDKKEVWVRKLNYIFGFCFIWSFGASYTTNAKLDYVFSEVLSKQQMPEGSVLDSFYNEKINRFS